MNLNRSHESATQADIFAEINQRIDDERVEEAVPSPQRQAIVLAFRNRVRNAIKMMVEGRSKQDIINEHGSIVYKESMFKWADYWQTKRINAEGHAVSLQEVA